jgi:hypothetical protein
MELLGKGEGLDDAWDISRLVSLPIFMFSAIPHILIYVRVCNRTREVIDVGEGEVEVEVEAKSESICPLYSVRSMSISPSSSVSVSAHDTLITPLSLF